MVQKKCKILGAAEARTKAKYKKFPYRKYNGAINFFCIQLYFSLALGKMFRLVNQISRTASQCLNIKKKIWPKWKIKKGVPIIRCYNVHFNLHAFPFVLEFVRVFFYSPFLAALWFDYFSTNKFHWQHFNWNA